MTIPAQPRDGRGITLAEVLDGVAEVSHGDTCLTGISLDSRRIAPGSLYVGLPGTRVHGADYATSALERGAVAILTDSTGARLIGEVDVPVAVAEDVRVAMAIASARIFGEPARRMTMFGVTGTNGKTTTSFLTAAALADRQVGTIGTIGFQIDGHPVQTSRTTVTTPESPDLQALLALMAERGTDAVALEVSSHAMALARVAGIQFDVTGFINLGRDHLDFHPTVEEYFEAKASLFTPEMTRCAVINIADPAGAQLAVRARSSGVEVVSVGTPEADYHVEGFRSLSPLHTRAALHTPEGIYRLDLALPGAYNTINAMIAFAVARLVGTPAEAALGGLATASIPGRMQPVPLDGDAPLAIVDFAHTPQAVVAALQTFATVAGQVIAVLGAGGDRDRVKRPRMGQAAAENADVVIITDDNPRSEEPADIRAEVLAGARGRAKIMEIAGRAAAIRAALKMAGPDDVVAVLGKGHETGQIVGDVVHEFDDVAVVRQEWTALKKES